MRDLEDTAFPGRPKVSTERLDLASALGLAFPSALSIEHAVTNVLPQVTAVV